MDEGLGPGDHQRAPQAAGVEGGADGAADRIDVETRLVAPRQRQALADEGGLADDLAVDKARLHAPTDAGDPDYVALACLVDGPLEDAVGLARVFVVRQAAGQLVGADVEALVVGAPVTLEVDVQGGIGVAGIDAG